jgi:hypothetical protein
MVFFGLEFSFPQLGQVPIKYTPNRITLPKIGYKVKLSHNVTTKGFDWKYWYVLRRFDFILVD